jgi:enamine deaminase RidA (YjgF/YER057c/UK114 family)
MAGPRITKLNPDGLHRPVDNLYTHVVSAEAATLHRIGGMVAVDAEGRNMAVGDMAGQIKAVYEQVTLALAAAGLSWANVVHLYTFTTDMDSYLEAEREIAPAYLGERPPASTLVEVSRLVDKDWLVEVQADAVS